MCNHTNENEIFHVDDINLYRNITMNSEALKRNTSTLLIKVSRISIQISSNERPIILWQMCWTTATTMSNTSKPVYRVIKLPIWYDMCLHLHYWIFMFHWCVCHNLSTLLFWLYCSCAYFRFYCFHFHFYIYISFTLIFFESQSFYCYCQLHRCRQEKEEAIFMAILCATHTKKYWYL